MNDPVVPQANNGRRSFGTVLAEAAAVAVVGLALAFAANSLSPLGLKLGRNYFPAGSNGTVAAPLTPGVPRPGAFAVTNQTPEEQEIAARLKAKGLEVIPRNEAARLFRDPRYQQQLIVFVDARNDGNFRQGHIPGACQLDPYRAENYLASVLPACQAAEEVVVYCTGGECEDSEFAATLLRDAGIPVQKLRIYAAGFTDWKSNQLPVETGERNSGKILNASQ